LETTKGAMNNGQSRDTGNIGHNASNENKQNKKHSIEEKMNKTDPTRKPEANPGTWEG